MQDMVPFSMKSLKKWRREIKMRRVKKAVLPTICVLLMLCVAISGLYLFTDLFRPDGREAEAGTAYSSGSTGQTVRQIQTVLKNRGYYTGKVDGIFGKIQGNKLLYRITR